MSASKAGMNPTKHSPGVTSPAVFGPATAAPFARAAASTSITSCTGTCSVSTTRRGQPASIASIAAARTPSGGMKSTETSKPTARIASPALAKTGTPQCSAPARRGFAPATTRVPYACIRSVQNVPCRPVMPWTSTPFPATHNHAAPSDARPASRRSLDDPIRSSPGTGRKRAAFGALHRPENARRSESGPLLRIMEKSSRPAPQRPQPRRRSPRPSWGRGPPRGARGASPAPPSRPSRVR